ncbi:hypothetical protein ABT127_26045 [Streptomyces sp. NPDC001904]|uniref:hypothetical protein n=1 Tax=Streptomyces sp. NPDC001904 TaxID=3154531 RepID=UPI003331D0D0
MTVLVFLLSGVMVAWALDGALGLSFTAKVVPVERARQESVRSPREAPVLRTITGVTGTRLRLAGEAVGDALVARGRAAPAIRTRHDDRVADDALAVRVGGLSRGGSDERYRLRRVGSGYVLDAASAAGAAAGLYRFADRVRGGEDVQADRGRVVAPRLGLRLIDTGAVGLDADPARFAGGRDYSLNSDVVGTALLPRAPWVDSAKAEQIGRQFRTLVRHAVRDGYNGVVVPGFLEYVTFSGVGDGRSVYPAGDVHVARARAMVKAFAPVWRYAHEAGMRVYFQTDMLALSPPLRGYLEGEFGSLDTENAKLWSVYAAGLEELFHVMPFASGVMIRTGEGGSAYRLPGWDYTSAIEVTTARSVRVMLRSLLGATAHAGGDREVIFRTWSVGVGAVGDLHTNPASYKAVLDGIDDPRLIVSTKYSQGDFYSHLPLNPTLLGGSQRRIVEFQARREFEGQGALPDDVAELEQTALRRFLSANPRVEGVWTWAQSGGPLYAGPRSLYLRTGFWQLWDVNVYLTARLAQDPDTDLAEARAAWIRRTFSEDPSTVAAIGQILGLSRATITKGLYIGPYADTSAKALGLEPPPMMWIFEWDIATGDSATLSSIYAATRARVPEALADARKAVELSRRQQQLLSRTDAGTWRDPQMRERFADALAYQTNLLTVLGEYRSAVLWHQRWLDTGSAEASRQWHAAEDRFRTAAETHAHRYGNDLALPAYNFTAADGGLRRADRDPAMAWWARALLFALLLIAMAAMTLRRLPGAAGIRALLTGALRPWQVRMLPEPSGQVDRVVVWVLPGLFLVLSRAVQTWFMAPVHVAVTLGAWMVFAGVLRCAAGRHGYRLAAAVGGSALLRTLLLLGVLAVRGPGFYWFGFWTSASGRFLYVMVAWALFLWVCAAAWWALRLGYGLSVRRSWGWLLGAVGSTALVGAAVVWAVGTETSLSTWNDQMALLPWGLHRILGLTEYLGIPGTVPPALAVTAAAVTVASALLVTGRRRGGTAVKTDSGRR